MNTNRNGFTLTELLTVVLIVGTLSAIVLPKFAKVLDSFHVMEAEQIILTVRAEQEHRCTLDKKYTQQISRLTTVPSGVSVDGNTFSYGDFTYTLLNSGIKAEHVEKNYTLEIPSYTDGRICCDNCGELNRSYPMCADLMDVTVTPDYQTAAVRCL